MEILIGDQKTGKHGMVDNFNFPATLDAKLKGSHKRKENSKVLYKLEWKMTLGFIKDGTFSKEMSIHCNFVAHRIKTLIRLSKQLNWV